jgi:hypothetical protein
MIGKNWMKGLALAGAVAVALPVISNASTHYTGKTPASIAMMASSPVTPVKYVVRKHKHHSLVKKASLHRKHTKHLAVKKHTA